jgi:methylamine dehydrogenase accessory protein MauD
MEPWWMALLVALCGFFVLLGLVVLGILRQIGVIQRQLAESSPLNGLAPGTKAPDFILPTLAGQTMSLRQYLGRKVLLVFVGPSCGPCERVLPEIADVAASRGVRDTVLLISRGGRVANQELAGGPTRGLPLVYEEEPHVAQAYQVPGTPFACLVDERGVVRSASIIRSRATVDQLLGGVVHLSVGRVANWSGGLMATPETATTDTAVREEVRRGG